MKNNPNTGDFNSPIDVIEEMQNQINDFNFNKVSKWLYHFTNKFTDTEIPMEVIKQELTELIKNEYKRKSS